jgi:hypothetical protein
VGSNPAEEDGFLRVTNLFHDFLHRGSNAVDPISFYGMLKSPTGLTRDTCRQDSLTFLSKFPPALLLGVSAATRAENSGG